MNIQSQFGEEKHVIKQLDLYLSQGALQEDEYYDIRTAVTEACLNAMEHGNQLQNLLPVKIHFEWLESRLIIIVKDCGKGFGRIPTNREDDRGWGLAFIQHLMDYCTYYIDLTDRCFCMHMEKELKNKHQPEGL
ncbi:ATP-binding protein [Ammoniphilus resinae]|uniref:Serine/threonine-protein kinase RsbW n=1 Tax=Ammoniphilus resinae TaxID=861532 RepID=A0ABS4GT86_9BACL|nr:ATP-binding protein [Ammoniphilus resinae]MBP1933498.1 serine/threonine-protein kinase RsbW [Ammoniphilus resinae]